MGAEADHEPLTVTSLCETASKNISKLDEGKCPGRFACIEVLLYLATKKESARIKIGLNRHKTRPELYMVGFAYQCVALGVFYSHPRLC